MITLFKEKRGGAKKGIEQRASCTRATKGAMVRAKLLVMTHDYEMLQIKLHTAGLQTHNCTVTQASRQTRIIAYIQTFIEERSHV